MFGIEELLSTKFLCVTLSHMSIYKGNVVDILDCRLSS